MARLTWKREPDERGLARIGQYPRGFELRYKGVRLAIVRPADRRITGWYWHTSHPDIINLPRVNTARTPMALEVAKKMAEAHYRPHLAVWGSNLPAPDAGN